MTPSPEEIAAVRHTRAQLAEWGVPWPPPKGWRKRLIAGSAAVGRQQEIDLLLAAQRADDRATKTDTTIRPPNWWLKTRRKKISRAVARQKAAAEFARAVRAAELERSRSAGTELRKKPRPSPEPRE